MRWWKAKKKSLSNWEALFEDVVTVLQAKLEKCINSWEGIFEDADISFDANQWSSKVNSKFKLPKGIDFEVTGRYQSEVQTVQGQTADNLFADMGLRKKILKGKGVINFSVRDIFASRVRLNETDQADFYIYSRRQRGRFVTLGFSYGFGKGEAMEFSGQRRRH